MRGVKVNKVLIWGDVMIDQWHIVEPTHISYEAPVIIGRHKYSEEFPGGAANVMANCRALGAETALVGFIGTYGTIPDEWRASEHLIPWNEWVTIWKIRYIDPQRRQIFRLDYELPEPPLKRPADEGVYARQVVAFTMLRDKLEDLYPASHSVVISDYGKGTCHPELLQKLIPKMAKETFVVVNGKPQNAPYYKGASVVVFNLSEAREILRLAGEPITLTPALMMQQIRDICGAEAVIITRGEEGLDCYADFHLEHVPAPKVAVADVAGAGDTITATIGARGGISRAILEEAVENAAIVVSQHGTSIPIKEKA
jgi:D-beta-D-heptose 7-phosphate kinase/D-beta-D-heptose 1-phosphate adenosyltransferase